MTPTDQRPQECVYYKRCNKTCLIAGICKYFTSKTEKDGNNQPPSECKHLTDWWGCLLTDDGIWMQMCDYYPRCENCKHYEPKEKKDNEND